MAGFRLDFSLPTYDYELAPALTPEARPEPPTDKKRPRGLRNNNPLNIESGQFTKRQQGYAGSDGRFAQFTTLDDGINAADRLLRSYGRRGISSINGVINRWAPTSGGNNVSAYAASVSKSMGIGPDDAIDLYDSGTRRKLIEAMAQVENGQPLPATGVEVDKAAAGSPAPQENTAAADAAYSAAETQAADLNKGAPGRYQVIDQDEFDLWRTDWEQQNQSGGLGGDIRRSLRIGSDQLALSLREGVGMIPGIGQPIVKSLDAVDEWLTGKSSEALMNETIARSAASMTPGFQESSEKAWWDSDKHRLGPAWTDPRSYISGLAESAPGTLATMAPSMWLARGAYVARIALGVAPKAAAAAAARTALISGAILEGAQGGAQSAVSVRQTIEQMTPEQLANSDAMKALMDEGASFEEARDTLASDASAQAFVLAGAATGLFSGFGDRALVKIISEGVAGTIGRRIAKGIARGVVAEGLLEQAPQGAGQAVAENYALRQADPNRPLTTDVGEQVAGGLAVGGAMGAGFGGAGAAASRAEAPAIPQEQAAPAAEPAAPQRPEGSLGRAMQKGEEAAQQQVRQAADAANTEAAARISVPEGAPAPGTVVEVSPPDLEPFEATVDSYADGEALVVTKTGEIFQFPPAYLRDTGREVGGQPPPTRVKELTQAAREPGPVTIDEATPAPTEAESAAPSQKTPRASPEFAVTVGERRRLADLGYDEAAVAKMARPEVDRILAAQREGTPAPAKSGAPLTLELGNGREVKFPDQGHADLYDLGVKRQRWRQGGRRMAAGDRALLQERQAVAKALGIDITDVNTIANDYRRQIDEAAKGTEGVFEAPQTVALDAHARWWDGLDAAARKALLAEAGVKRSEKSLWRYFTPTIRKKLLKVRGAAETPAAEQVSAAGEPGSVDAAAHGAATSPTNALPEPTPLQQKAGNYKKGKLRIGGLDISIENPVGSKRSGIDPNGKPWSVTMRSHYGYIRGSEGKDGDQLDVFIKEGTPEDLPDDAPVFVIDQRKRNGHFDEHKAMLGFKTEPEAKRAYLRNYARGWTGLGKVTPMTLAAFRDWVRTADLSRPAIETPPIGGITEAENARPVRSDEGQVPPRGNAVRQGPSKGSGNLQQQASEQPGRTRQGAARAEEAAPGREEVAQPAGESEQQTLFRRAAGPKKPTTIAASAAAAQPVFYSQIVRSVEEAKLNKGSAGQWLGYLKKQPGVKQEELDWLGLQDWLQAQKGAVTKEALADFVRANQVEVREVVKQTGDQAAISLTSDTTETDGLRVLRFETADGRLFEAEKEEDADAFDVTEMNRSRPGRVEANLTAWSGQRPTTEAEIEATIQQYLAGDNVTGDVSTGPKFGEYQLPGGENYRELLLTLPSVKRSRSFEDFLAAYRERFPDATTSDAEVRSFYDRGVEVPPPQQLSARTDPDVFRSSHWDEPNVLAHIRFNERTDAEGRQTLFIEEVQSDWHQAGRKRGYKIAKPDPALRSERDKLAQEVTEIQAAADKENYRDYSTDPEWWRRMDRITELNRLLGEGGIPDAPFKTTWPELALKRAIRWAAENGFDQIAWTPGEVQAERYDLSKQVDVIYWTEIDTGITLDAEKDKRNVFHQSELKPSELDSRVGKDVADRIRDSLNRGESEGALRGDDLKVGGEGMRAFYDKMLVNTANKLGKKFDAKVGTTSIETDERQEGPLGLRRGRFNAAEVWSLPITDKMRKAAMQGQALFERAGAPVVPKLNLSGAEKERLRRDLGRRVRNIFGKEITIRFADVLSAEEVADPNYDKAMDRYGEAGGSVSDRPGGYIRFEPSGDAIIAIALADPLFDPRETAYHEAYHGVEALLMTDKEFETAISDEAMAFARDLAGANLGFAPESPQMRNFPGFETRATAFQEYARRRDAGLPIGKNILPNARALTRFWERLRRLIRGVRRSLNDQGYQTLEDIFEAAYRGEFSERPQIYRPIMNYGQTARPEYTVKPPKKLWRGIVEGHQESGVEGTGTAMLGKGLYSSPSKSFAKKYAVRRNAQTGQLESTGRVVEVSIADGWPRRPLVLRGTGGAPSLFLDWVFRNSDFANAREFNGAYPDPAQFVREKGYDGVIAGDEVVRYPERPASAQTLARSAIPKSREELVDAMKGMAEDRRNLMLSIVNLNYLPDFARPGQTAIQEYVDTERRMRTYRNEWQTWADDFVQDWRKAASADPAAATALSDLMHDTTLAGVDPTVTTSKERGKPGYAELKARFDALPAQMRGIYTEIRDAYLKQVRELDDVILEHMRKSLEMAVLEGERAYERDLQAIKDEGLIGAERDKAVRAAEKRRAQVVTRGRYANKARLTKMRQSFEANRVEPPYFAIGRFGEYFVGVRDLDGSMISWSRFENEADRKFFVKEMQREHPTATIETGVLSNSSEVKRAVDPRLVAEVGEILKNAGVESEVMDAIWQRYLQTMPDLSIRRRFIHRKGTAGFNKDALRTFSSHMFHAAHQMGRLKYSPDLAELVNKAEDQAKKADRPVQAGKLSNELRKRHEWVMNPRASSWASLGTSIGFVYFLGVRPSAAIVNLTQTTMLGIPIMGAKFGAAKSASALGKALKDFTAGKGSVQGAKLTRDENAAIDELYLAGVLDRTRTMELAGVAEEGLKYSPLLVQVMAKMSFLFHKAEVLNREVTALASYRLARKKGLDHAAAVKMAGDLTYKVHFDYANANRPRIMQNDFARVALLFRNFQVNMLYRLFRDVHDSFRGESPQARREARYQLAGITGMMAAHAGLMGTPFIAWVIIPLWGMIFGDKDDPTPSTEQFRQDVEAALGPELGGLVLDGIPGTAAGIALTDRIGMPDMWFRGDDRDQTAQQWWDTLTQEMLGPLWSIGDNLVRGWSVAHDGRGVARGIEIASPRFVADALKSWRIANEGFLNLRGDPLIPREETSMFEIMAAITGFTPAELAAQYRRNTAKTNMQDVIYRRRRVLLNDYFQAREAGNQSAMDDVKERISEFNAVPIHRALRITPKTLRMSLRQRQRVKRKVEGGVLIQNERLNRDINARLERGRAFNEAR